MNEERLRKGEPMRKILNEDDVLKEIDRWIGYLDEDMITRIKIGIKKLPSAQPELIEKASYVRGFEQGRTQGMIDVKEGKK